MLTRSAMAMRRCGAVVAAALLAAVPLGGCETNPATGRSQFSMMSTDEERALGAQAAPQFVEEFGGAVPDAQLQAYVDGVGRKLVAQVEEGVPDFDWEFHLLNSPVINAFALPGGKVFITRGLTEKMNNEAQLAGVLGHEIGHVTARHANDRMASQLGFNAVLAGLAIAAGVADEDSGFRQVGQYGIPALAVGGNLVLLKWGRDEESEADSLGLRYMTRAGYNPRAQVQVMEILAAASAGQGGIEWTASHPLPETRIRRLEQEIAEQYEDEMHRYEFFEDRFQTQALARLNRLPAAPSGNGSSGASQSFATDEEPVEQVIGRPRR